MATDVRKAINAAEGPLWGYNSVFNVRFLFSKNNLGLFVNITIMIFQGNFLLKGELTMI